MAQQWGVQFSLNEKWWVPLKKCEFYELVSVVVGSVLRSDSIYNQSHQRVPMNCNNFPKWCMFMKANVILEVEIVWNDFLLLWGVWYERPFLTS